MTDVDFEGRLMRYIANEALATRRACQAAGDASASTLAMAAVAVGLDVALRAAVMDPDVAEHLRDRIAGVIHFSPGADPRGAEHANASARALLDLLR